MLPSVPFGQRSSLPDLDDVVMRQLRQLRASPYKRLARIRIAPTVRRASLAVITSILAGTLYACGGGGSNSQRSLGPVVTPSPARDGRLTFSFTVPKNSTHAHRVPSYVSASTQAIVVQVTSQTSQQTTTDVLPCTAVCSGSLAAPPGVDTVKFRLLDKPPIGSPASADPTAKMLATGTVVVLIVPDVDNVIHATLDGVVKNITMVLAPGVVNAGAPANTFLIVNAFDPDDNLITYDGTWIDGSGSPVVVDVVAPLANILGGSFGSHITVAAPGTVIPIIGTFNAGLYSFTAAVRSGNPTVSTITPVTLLSRPNVVLGTTPIPSIPQGLQIHPFTLADNSIAIGFIGDAPLPRAILVSDVLGRILFTGPAYSLNQGLEVLVPQPGLVDFPLRGGGDQAFVLASSTFQAVNAPGCGAGDSALFSGPINPSTGNAPFTLCASNGEFTLQSATQSYAVPVSFNNNGVPGFIPAAFIASPNSDANAWCSAGSCLVFGSGSGIASVVTDVSAASVGTVHVVGAYAAYDVDRAIAITLQGGVYQLSVQAGTTTLLYQSGIQSPDAICRVADGSATVVLGHTILGGISQAQVGVYRSGIETVGPIPPGRARLSFVPGANCRFAFDFNSVDAVLF